MASNDWYDDPSVVNEPWCIVCGSYNKKSCTCSDDNENEEEQ